MPRRIYAAFHPRGQPWITRQSYTHELVNALTFPMAVAMVEGGVIGILAEKTFRVSAFEFAAITAAPSFANITSFLWAHWARGRRKIAFINRLQIATLVGIGAVALLPVADPGPALLTVLVILVRCLLAGIVTLRSAIWRQNYPREVRATVTGRLTVLQSAIMAFTPLALYAILDHDPRAFRWIYLGSIAVAYIGVTSLGKVRLRGEGELLRFERQPDVKPSAHGAPPTAGGIFEYDAATPHGGFWAVLQRDPLFRRYMLWQFVAGGANMMGEIVIIAMVAQLTRDLPNQYAISILLTTTIPMLLALATLPMWARRLDRMHVVAFRARQAWWWLLDQGGNWLVGYLWISDLIAPAQALFFLGFVRLVQGTVRGAGMLAWNLGHNDFADRRLVAQYMGVHVMLTGVRGVFVPFVGMLLFAGWGPITLPGLELHIPGAKGIGPHVFAVTLAATILANIGFHALARQVGQGKLRE